MSSDLPPIRNPIKFDTNYTGDVLLRMGIYKHVSNLPLRIKDPDNPNFILKLIKQENTEGVHKVQKIDGLIPLNIFTVYEYCISHSNRNAIAIHLDNPRNTPLLIPPGAFDLTTGFGYVSAVYPANGTVIREGFPINSSRFLKLKRVTMEDLEKESKILKQARDYYKDILTKLTPEEIKMKHIPPTMQEYDKDVQKSRLDSFNHADVKVMEKMILQAGKNETYRVVKNKDQEFARLLLTVGHKRDYYTNSKTFKENKEWMIPVKDIKDTVELVKLYMDKKGRKPVEQKSAEYVYFIDHNIPKDKQIHYLTKKVQGKSVVDPYHSYKDVHGSIFSEKIFLYS